jgi:hypothetical protein
VGEIMGTYKRFTAEDIEYMHRNYRDAVNKNAQITIFSEIFACPRERIIEVVGDPKKTEKKYYQRLGSYGERKQCTN